MARRSTTRFAEMVAACGLSQAEAAVYLDRSLSSIQKAFRGTPVPESVYLALAELYVRVDGWGDPGELPEGAARRRTTILDLRRLHVPNRRQRFVHPDETDADRKLHDRLRAILGDVEGVVVLDEPVVAEVWLDDERQVWLHYDGAVELVRGESGQSLYIDPEENRERPMREAAKDPFAFARRLWDEHEGVGHDEDEE